LFADSPSLLEIQNFDITLIIDKKYQILGKIKVMQLNLFKKQKRIDKYN
jgi:hypothetical protein